MDSLRNSCRITEGGCQRNAGDGRQMEEYVMKPLYVSPFEQFLNSFKERNPKVDEEQRLGRALLWDKMPMGDLDGAPYGTGNELQQPSYVYYANDD
jgi:hypothetical protein